jgi:hypothetical protein
MSGKRYRSLNPATIDPVPFELEVYRDGVSEIHEFTARPNIDIGPMLKVAQDLNDVAKMAPIVIRTMSKMLDNTDGVPLDWEVVPLEKPGNAGPNWEPKFRGPDGKLYPMDKATRFTAVTAGSSRRRWAYLMYEDDGASVDLATMMEIMQDMISVAANRPTPASSR